MLFLLVGGALEQASIRLAQASAVASAASAPPAGAQWHDDAMGKRQGLAPMAERATINRSGNQSTDDALPSAPWALARPEATQTARRATTAAAPASPASAAYRARAPPTRA